ncbi:MAG: hypothetical protein CBE47_01150 [Pelagibacteraceae bacterium TMED287]|nr:MAG: hypothetical protein CBE47_01150 [Pelagibacteraceae bacterium TMED287]
MEIHKPYLFIEIDDKNFVFLTVEYNEENNFKILDSFSINSEGITDGKVINADTCSRVIRDSLDIIEKKIKFNFKNVTVVNNQDNFQCINISGFKKLDGSQILNQDISFILNNIKNLINDCEQQKSLIHLFNSNFILDNNTLDNLPVGLHGEFYSHDLTFYLLPKNDLRNIKLVFNKCEINVERIICKKFVEGIDLIKNNGNSFTVINLRKEKSHVSIFINSSFVYSESFSFGTDIIMRDVSKICSLDLKIVKKIFSSLSFDEKNKDYNNAYLEKKFFEGSNFRKISISHLKDIIDARIKELVNLIHKSNINLKYFNTKNNIVCFKFEDESIPQSCKSIFKNNYREKDEVRFISSDKDEHLKGCINSAELTSKGWEKEAIPIIQTKKSIISRIFSSIFN